MLLGVFEKTQRYRTKIKKNSMKRVKTVVTDDNKPSAWIVNPSDRGRKSIKKGSKVYLQDGQNFEIELHNPLQESVLADIKINGSSVSKSGLVIRPGQRFYLDCFVDDKKKFVFNTYEVENTQEAKTAISKNGMVEVFFYKEETNILTIKTPRYIREYYPVYYPYYHPYPHPLYNPFNTYCSNQIVGYSSGTDNGILGSSYTTSISTNAQSTQYTTNSFYSSTSMNSNLNSNLKSSTYTNLNPNIETGRVEMGESSKQEFEEVDMNFQKFYISHVMYQILPESQKPVETDEIARKFCSECGTKFKGTEKFCPECGTKI